MKKRFIILLKKVFANITFLLQLNVIYRIHYFGTSGLEKAGFNLIIVHSISAESCL